MNNHNHNHLRDGDFVHYLESMVNLNALDRITMELDDEIKNSQLVMNEIKGMIDKLPVKNVKSEPDNNGLRHEDVSNFLSAGTPNLLMPDMVENTVDVDLDDVIATMKSYTEDLLKNFTPSESETGATSQPKQLEDLGLEQYASSLDQLCKRLSNMKVNKTAEGNNRDTQVETKLSLLCDDVNMFIKMVQAKTTLSKANKNWSPTQQETNALNCDDLINKLLSGINEVSYLLALIKN